MKIPGDGLFRKFDFEFEKGVGSQARDVFLERHVKRTTDGVVLETNDWSSTLPRRFICLLLAGCCVFALASIWWSWDLGYDAFGLALFVFLNVAAIVLLGIFGHFALIQRLPLSTEWNNKSRTVRHCFTGAFRHGELVFRYNDFLGFDVCEEHGEFTSHHLRMAIRFGASVEETNQWIWSGGTPFRLQFILSTPGLWRSIFQLLVSDHAEFELTPAGSPWFDDLERARDLLVKATGLPVLQRRKQQHGGSTLTLRP